MFIYWHPNFQSSKFRIDDSKRNKRKNTRRMATEKSTGPSGCGTEYSSIRNEPSANSGFRIGLRRKRNRGVGVKKTHESNVKLVVYRLSPLFTPIHSPPPLPIVSSYLPFLTSSKPTLPPLPAGRPPSSYFRSSRFVAASPDPGPRECIKIN